MDDLMVRFSRCCTPVPGDEIIGFITKGRGISVHRADCINIQSLPEIERERLIAVQWDTGKDGQLSYDVDVCVLAHDRRGLFSDLSKVCDEINVDIIGVNARADKENVANITMTLSLNDTGQLEKLLTKLRNVNGVADVYRAVV